MAKPVARVYAKISLEIWGDEKFCRLSRLPPSGQSLWLYLLVGRFRTSIPGLNLNVGPGALADRLGWPRALVTKHWQEISRLEMAHADWEQGVVWLPRGIAHNPPENPNVIKGWTKHVLPQCPLVADALITLHTYIQAHLTPAHLEAFRDGFWSSLREGFPEGLSKGFPKGFPEPFPEPSDQGSRNQEQEQEQDLIPPVRPPKGGSPARLRKPSSAERRWAETFRRTHGCTHEPRCVNEPQCIGKLVAWRRLEEQHGMAEEAQVG